ncbi:MAG: metallophosphoesterase [Clostridia bacterium]|nr:metallophosphoesterase [Clostridia bacterium]
MKTECCCRPEVAGTFDFVLEKRPDRDYVILVLSDTQMLAWWWSNEASPERNSLRYTIEELINNTDPDLILCTGDITADGREEVFRDFGVYMDSLEIPWATVWGNHDHTYRIFPDYGMSLADMEALYTNGFKNCLFCAGDPAMGSGNFTIGICEGERFVEAIFMMDSHTVQAYTDADGHEFMSEASINDAQQAWYRERVEAMRQLGCLDSTIVTHQPLTGHAMAFRAALADLDTYTSQLRPDSAKYGVGWREEYKDTSFGIFRVKCDCAGLVCGHIHPDDGMHDLLRTLGHTKNAVCGHCHENNMSVLFEGIRYTHGLKTGGGANSYWNFDFGQNGGTVIRVASDGVTDLYHEYVPYPDFFEKSQCHGKVRAPFDPEYNG